MTINALNDSALARDIIDRVYDGKPNFMTPVRIGCYLSRKYAIELSTNDDRPGDFGYDMYGVTVVTRGGEKRPDLSQSFQGRKAATDYILQLKRLKH